MRLKTGWNLTPQPPPDRNHKKPFFTMPQLSYQQIYSQAKNTASAATGAHINPH
jgi:hypothetical protein